jgi:hypothetical protein
MQHIHTRPGAAARPGISDAGGASAICGELLHPVYGARRQDRHPDLHRALQDPGTGRDPAAQPAAPAVCRGDAEAGNDRSLHGKGGRQESAGPGSFHHHAGRHGWIGRHLHPGSKGANHHFPRRGSRRYARDDQQGGNAEGNVPRAILLRRRVSAQLSHHLGTHCRRGSQNS